VRLLVEAGANIRAKNKKGETAWVTAVKEDHVAIAQLLLRKLDQKRE
jgi:ankyrin repeat protein